MPLMSLLLAEIGSLQACLECLIPNIGALQFQGHFPRFSHTVTLANKLHSGLLH